MEVTRNPLPGLKLDRYRKAIQLDENHDQISSSFVTEEQYVHAVNELLYYFVHAGLIQVAQIPMRLTEKRKLLHAIQNVWQTQSIDPHIRSSFATVLEYELKEKGIIELHTIPTLEQEGITAKGLSLNQLMVWKGDITRLKADAIVNAANNQMLGCFQPLHACIDNAIHTSAGPQLRIDCETIMKIQNHPEWTGDAKITKAYHLPAQFVLHTVGPIILDKKPRDIDEASLASCYVSCLHLAAQVESIRSVAFCGISTGIFGYPKQSAAKIAIHTVNDWITEHRDRFDRVVFNVFSSEDEMIYRKALTEYNRF